MILAIGSCGYKMIRAMTPMAPAPTEETATKIPRTAPTLPSNSTRAWSAPASTINLAHDPQSGPVSAAELCEVGQPKRAGGKNFLSCCSIGRARSCAHYDRARRSRLLVLRRTTAAGSGGRSMFTQPRRFVDAIGCSMAVWLRFFASKTVTCGIGYLFFISFAAFSAASYVPNPDFSCRSTAT